MKFEEIDVVASVHDWPEYDVLAGDIGTVVLVHGEHEAYEVEFMHHTEGYLIALLTMGPDDIRWPTSEELKRPRRDIDPKEHMASVFPRAAKVS